MKLERVVLYTSNGASVFNESQFNARKSFSDVDCRESLHGRVNTLLSNELDLAVGSPL